MAYATPPRKRKSTSHRKNSPAQTIASEYSNTSSATNSLEESPSKTSESSGTSKSTYKEVLQRRVHKKERKLRTKVVPELKSLKEEELAKFLFKLSSFRPEEIDIPSVLSYEIWEMLNLEYHLGSHPDPRKVIKILEQKLVEVRKKVSGHLTNLKANLKWPSDEIWGKTALTKFFLQITKLLNGKKLDCKDFYHTGKIVKTIIKKLPEQLDVPSSLAFDRHEFMNLEKLHKYLEKKVWVLNKTKATSDSPGEKSKSANKARQNSAKRHSPEPNKNSYNRNRFNKNKFSAKQTQQTSGDAQSSGEKMRTVNVNSTTETRLTDTEIDCLNKEDTYQRVDPACLDTGCTAEGVGGIQKHKALCEYTWRLKKPVKIVVADKREHICTMQGCMWLRLKYKGYEYNLGKVNVYLVDDPNWDELLIGELTLKRHRLLPTQRLLEQLKKLGNPC